MRKLAAVAAGLLLSLPLLAQQAAPPIANPKVAGAAASSETFTAAVANDLLNQFARGMEGRNSRMTLGAFDAAKFPEYERFSAQVSAWFREMSGFRVYYKVKQASMEDARGVAMVEFEYEATPSAEGESPVRRHEQMRFAFERGAKGWKIVELSPRNLFS
ncbi:MAG: hypothetical protein HYX28_09095 [Candidatus Koribacter versatilis]|uniref:SnoaL-like domain-containing protein n=1 Tax=Candidatus Korobacter versatilis TaxID=658062 RepID=A0A932ERJ3_9BACT|nr:hypothetical protein [Candidatus Koribacter versatilis]